MKLNRIALTVALLALLALVVPGAIAEEKHAHEHDHEKRQHDAHVHGIAALNLVLEGREVHIELDSPAANIVGFEHAPSSEADHAALDRAVATLKDGDRLFRFNAEAGCRMEKAHVTSALLDEEHGEHADDHDHEKKDSHGHDEHEHEKHGHDERGHEEHEGETHSDIDAAYHFECDQPGKLTQLTVELFEAFPGMQELNVQYVIESKQGATELTPADHVVKF
jgi:hypothetical protein